MFLLQIITRLLKLVIKNIPMILILLSFLLYYITMILPKNQQTHPVTLKYTVIHLDLKGSPPRLEYLRSLLPLWQSLGANGILLEYDDMFPYEEQLVNLSAVNRYNAVELQIFIRQAAKRGFEIIPLIQTFGHMEHALKLKEYQHLREDPGFPDTICPTNLKSISLIGEMLKQIIKFHQKLAPLNFIHVGCDEVYTIGKCNLCRSTGLHDMSLFLNHVKTVAGIVAMHNPQTTVLIWNDMLRFIDHVEWNNLPYLGKVVPVYWDYKPNLKLNHVNLFRYHKHFGEIWAASAFKGADGRTATIPDMRNRYLNHFTWLKNIHKYKFAGEDTYFNFTGIILTGWSRYTHMDPACELLPVSIPSLVLNLLAIEAFKKGFTDQEMQTLDANILYQKYLVGKFSEVLSCTKGMNYINFNASSCIYDGVVLYKTVEALGDFKTRYHLKYYDDKESQAAFRYYCKRGYYANRMIISSRLMWGQTQLKKIIYLENLLRDALSKYYDKYFRAEYIGLKIFDDRQKIALYISDLKKNINLKTWERRYIDKPIDTETNWKILNNYL